MTNKIAILMPELVIYMYVLFFSLSQALFSALLSCVLGFCLNKIFWHNKCYKLLRFFNLLGKFIYVMPTIIICCLVIFVLGNNAFSIYGIIIGHILINMLFCSGACYRIYKSFFSKNMIQHLALARSGIWNTFKIEIHLLKKTIMHLFVQIFVMCLHSFTICLVLGNGIKSTTFALLIYQYAIVDPDINKLLIYVISQILLTLLITFTRQNKQFMPKTYGYIAIKYHHKWLLTILIVLLCFAYYFNITYLLLATCWKSTIAAIITVIISIIAINYLVYKQYLVNLITHLSIVLFSIPGIIIIIVVHSFSNSIMLCSILYYLPFSMFIISKEIIDLYQRYEKTIILNRLGCLSVCLRLIIPAMHKKITDLTGIIGSFITSNAIIALFLGDYDQNNLAFKAYDAIINYEFDKAVIYSFAIIVCNISIILISNQINLYACINKINHFGNIIRKKYVYS